MRREAFATVLLAAMLLGAACGGDPFSQDNDTAGQGGTAQAGTGSGGAGGSTGGAAAGGSVGASGGSAGAGAVPGAGGAANAGGAGGMPNECPCSAPTPTCDEGRCIVRGPTMIKVGGFYVDSTEVTVAEYGAFVQAKGDDTSGQTPECSWNDSFEPSVGNPNDQQPVTHVDFCDAVAFCAWADKQLCGSVDGTPLLFAELSLASRNQWFRACGGSDAQPYPYGTTPQQGACNDVSGEHSLADVASFPGCEGFPSGVFDMVGNVAEWVNACDAAVGSFDGCETMGGSYADGLGCTGSSLKHRDEQLPTVGFRCCSG